MVGSLLQFAHFTSSPLQSHPSSYLAAWSFIRHWHRCTLRSLVPWASQIQFLISVPVFMFFPSLFFFFITWNLQSMRGKWDCNVIWGKGESLEVEKYPSFNFQFWCQTIWTIPKDVFEKIYIKCLQPDVHKLPDVNIVHTAFRDKEGNSYFKLTWKGCWWGSYDQDKWVTMHQGFFLWKMQQNGMTFPILTRLTRSRCLLYLVLDCVYNCALNIPD